MFQRPRQIVGHIDTPATRLQDRDHVRAQRVADHQCRADTLAVAGKDLGVGGGGLVADNLDPVEKIAKAGLRQFAFLIQQVALGNQQGAKMGGQRLNGFARAGQQFDRVAQHVLPCRDQFRDDCGGNAFVSHLDCGFDHRQREALDAETVVAKVAAFGGNKAVVQWAFVDVVGEEFGKAGLREAKESLVLPEGVVGIEADCGETGGHLASFRQIHSILRILPVRESPIARLSLFSQGPEGLY
ncbi:hypothetical protein GALL_516250 [mine drainage metagenome]|uniref:Uncharacterized protein n=1 Tax=mine drainage metagenome TaxID=410659 RepID=A0A1J5P6G2_9ZZZZ